VPATRPFEVEGKWWALTNMTADGTFQITASSKPAETKKEAGPDLSPGRKAPVFTGRLLGGKTVKFPDDYKGKVVLLDFWATWCGPCVAELPNVVKAYGKYHEQGLEVLGISLDREDWEEKLAEFTRKKNMPWPQVYDGKFWGAEVAKLYGIDSIPHMLLVDGETGVILADKTIRGEKLAPAIEEALAARKKK
jgi:peroxiredoxin